MSIIFSGFADEISADLDKQIEVVKRLGMEYISARAIDGKNIADYTPEEFKESVLPRLEANGIKISSMGSPIGKVFIDDEEGFAKQLVDLENICEICHMVGCRYIRIFSFFIKKEENYDDYKEQVIEKLKQFVAIAEKHNIILLHENEKDIYGDIGRRCVDLFEAIESPYFKAIFDFANFVQCEQETIEAYNMLEKYILYYHIKDARKEVTYNVLCGTGDGNIETILADAFAKGYEGFLTLEPHLAMFGTLQSLELAAAANVVNTGANINGEQGYELQYQAIVRIVEGLKNK